jgi:2-dehydropantoate 2-reductase
MNVYIVGRGAVGTYLGQQLSSIGVNVTFAPRHFADVEPILADVAIVATKAYHTTDAIETLRKAIRDPLNCVFVTPQNGVGNEELLAAAFGPSNVVAAALTIPVDLDSEGVAIAAKSGGLAFAPVGTSAFNWLTATFASTGMNVRVLNDWRALKWSKLALNVIANAGCAILDVLPERLVQSGVMFDLEIRMVREVAAVMKAAKIPAIDLPRYPTRALFAAAALPTPLARLALGRSFARGRGAKPPSLLLDLRGGKPETEVAYLNGAVAAAAARARVAAPVNATYARLVESIARTPDLWMTYREQPHAVIAEVEGARRLDARP